MDRYQRWGKKVDQRQEQRRYEKRPQHARVPLRVLRCADCFRALSARHPVHLGDRCGSCWQGLWMAEGVEGYVQSV